MQVWRKTRLSFSWHNQKGAKIAFISVAWHNEANDLDKARRKSILNAIFSIPSKQISILYPTRMFDISFADNQRATDNEGGCLEAGISIKG